MPLFTHCVSTRAQLRLSKVSELIHNSAEHRDLQQARVSVFFEEIIDKVRTIAAPPAAAADVAANCSLLCDSARFRGVAEPTATPP